MQLSGQVITFVFMEAFPQVCDGYKSRQNFLFRNNQTLGVLIFVGLDEHR